MKKYILIILGILTLSLCSTGWPSVALPTLGIANYRVINLFAISINFGWLKQQAGSIFLALCIIILTVTLVIIISMLNDHDNRIKKLELAKFQNDKQKSNQQAIPCQTANIESRINHLENKIQNDKQIEHRLANLESELNLLRIRLRDFQEAPPQPTQYQEPWQNFSSQSPESPNLSSFSYMDQLVTLYNQNLPELAQKGVKVNVTPESVRRASTSLSFENIEFVEQNRSGTFVIISDNSSDQAYLFPIYSMPQALELQREIIPSLYEIPNSLRGSHEGAQLQKPALVQELGAGRWRLSERGKINSTNVE